VRTSDTVVTIPVTGTPTAANDSAAALSYAGSLPAANITGASTAVTPTGAPAIGAIEKGDGAAVHWPGSGLFEAPKADMILINPAAFIDGNPGGQAVEYAISTSAVLPSEGWEELPIVDGAVSFTGLTQYTVYYIFARSKANANYHAGAAVYIDARTPSLRGDVNCDGKVEVDDAALLLRYLAGLATLSERGRLNADVTLDGTVQVDDAAKILRYLVGLISSL